MIVSWFAWLGDSNFAGDNAASLRPSQTQVETKWLGICLIVQQHLASSSTGLLVDVSCGTWMPTTLSTLPHWVFSMTVGFKKITYTGIRTALKARIMNILYIHNEFADIPRPLRYS